MKIKQDATKKDFVISMNTMENPGGKPIDFINILPAENPEKYLKLQLPVMETFGINKTYGGQVLPTPSFSLKLDRIVIDRERSLAALKEELPDTPEDAEPHPCLVYMKINEDKATRPDDRKAAQQQLNVYNYLLAMREAVVDWLSEPVEVEDKRRGTTKTTTRAAAVTKKHDMTTRMAIRSAVAAPVSKYDSPGNASDNVMEGKYGPNIKIKIKPEKTYAAKTLVSTNQRTVTRGFGSGGVDETIRVEDKAYSGCRIRAMVRVASMFSPLGPIIGLEMITFQYLNRVNKRQIEWDDDDLTEEDRNAAEQETKKIKSEPSGSENGDANGDGYGGYGAPNEDLGLDDML